MIAKGRCRGNGAQLAQYLLHDKANERSEVLAIRGTATPNDFKKSLLEMSLTSELSDRTDAGLYHSQLSPRSKEAAAMTLEQKLRMAEIFTEHLGMPENQKWVLVEQKKEGRIHFHMVHERYDHTTGKMWDDDGNYDKHKAASRQMEKEFGWKLTYDKTNRLEPDIKDHILKLWKESGKGQDFVKSMDKAGFEVVQGIDRRPYQIVDQHGTIFDLTRQLKGVLQKDVSELLNPIRDTLRTSSEACKETRKTDQLEKKIAAKAEKQSDKKRGISDSQDLMQSMKDVYNQEDKKKDLSEKPSFNFKILDQFKDNLKIEQPDRKREISDSQDVMQSMKYVYNQIDKEKGLSEKSNLKYKINYSPSLPQKKTPEIERSDNSPELSNRQDIATSMIKQHRNNQEQAKKQKTANDNDPLAKFRVDQDNDPLAKFRDQKNEQSRPKERTRERGQDVD